MDEAFGSEACVLEEQWFFLDGQGSSIIGSPEKFWDSVKNFAVDFFL